MYGYQSQTTILATARGDKLGILTRMCGYKTAELTTVKEDGMLGLCSKARRIHGWAKPQPRQPNLLLAKSLRQYNSGRYHGEDKPPQPKAVPDKC